MAIIFQKKLLRPFALARDKLIREASLIVNTILMRKYLNIGGGKNFSYFGWENLEAVKSRYNKTPFYLTPQCLFPFKSAQFELSYSSHVFEHLDDETLQRVLFETRRTLRSGGDFIVKIPDFDRALLSLRTNDRSFFDEKQWNLASVLPSWINNSVEDCIENRAAFLFCGIWTTDTGNPFADVKKASSAGYHGPPKLSQEEVSRILAGDSPHEISQRLVDRAPGAIASEYDFNHRNAWSRSEITAILTKGGFKVNTTDTRIIIQRFKGIPGIRAMHNASLYIWATKT